MAIGMAKTQGEFLDAAVLLADQLEEGSVYGLLAEHGHRLFGDAYFADLFVATRKGRPSVPARVVATVMLLQSLEGLSDREAIDRLRFDLRWQAAAGLTVAPAGFHPTVLCQMRSRLRASQRPRRLFTDTRDLAKQVGLARGKVRAVDSTPLFDAVATQDTVTQLRAAVRKLLAALPGELQARVRAALSREDDYATLGKPPCDWDDPAAREALVDALVVDALAALAVVDGLALAGRAAEAAELLALVAGQDTDRGEDGIFRIVRGVAKDRVISTVDVDARHGHKSKHRRFDGYKTHLAIDPACEIITEAAATPANTPDRDVAADLITDLTDTNGDTDGDAAHAHAGDVHDSGQHPGADGDDAEPGDDAGDGDGGDRDGDGGPHRPTLVGDSAYADAATRKTLAERGVDTMAKVPPARNSRGGFTKDDFRIDTDLAAVTCPAGHTAPIRPSVRGGGRAAFGAARCRDCPLRDRCTSAVRGRVVTIHPDEALLQRAKAEQAAPAWQSAYRAARPTAERKIAHFTRRLWGGRAARTRGLHRIATDVDTRAGVLNLARLATLGLTWKPTGWQLAPT